MRKQKLPFSTFSTFKHRLQQLLQLLPMLSLLLGTMHLVRAQGGDIVAQGKFISDSVLIGDEVQFVLTAKVRPQSVVVFPDSGANFGDFVFKSLRWFPQRSLDDSSSLDSMVYTLACFADSGFVYLSMPLTEILPNGDSVLHFPASDSVFLHSKMPPQAADEQLEFMPLAHEINYPYIVGGVFLSLLLVIGLNLLLGKPIQRYWQLFLLARRYAAYQNSFKKLNANLLVSGNSSDMERLLNLWKNFMQRITSQPYSTYTTKDIASLETPESLIQSLSAVDKWVYGGIEPAEKPGILAELKQFSLKAYANKRRSIKNERKSV